MADFIIEIIVEVLFRAVIYAAFSFVSGFIAQRLGLGGRLSGCLSFLFFAVIVVLCIGAVTVALSSPAAATPIPR